MALNFRLRSLAGSAPIHQLNHARFLSSTTNLSDKTKDNNNVLPSQQSPNNQQQQQQPRTQQHEQQQQPKAKSTSQADSELREKLEAMSGEGGASGIEYEDGKPSTMKRSVKNNMFRYI